MTLRIMTPADNSSVVTVAEAKAHSRISTSAEDSLIEIYLETAINFVHKFLNGPLLVETWRLSLECFPASDEIPLDKLPFSSLTAFQYYNSSGVWTAVDSSVYELDTETQPARLVLKSGKTWPTPGNGTYAARVDFVAGYANAGAIPGEYKNAILCIALLLYEARGDSETILTQLSSSGAAARLLWPSRQVRFA